MKTYNEDLRQRMIAYRDKAKAAGVAQNKIASAIGISQTLLSQYCNGKYEGDISETERKVEEFLRTRELAAQTQEQTAPYRQSGQYVPITVREDVYRAIQFCQMERGLAVLYGDAGVGKTMGAKKFVRDHPLNALNFRSGPIDGGLTATMRNLAEHLKVPDCRNRQDMLRGLKARLRGTDKVIIIDEAQNLKYETLQQLYQLTDEDDETGEPGTGICLIGNQEVYDRMLGRQEAQFAQQFTRVKLRRSYSIAKMTKEDFAKIFPMLADDEHKKELDFLFKVARGRWGIRGAVNIYNNAANTEDISEKNLREWTMNIGVGVL